MRERALRLAGPGDSAGTDSPIRVGGDGPIHSVLAPGVEPGGMADLLHVSLWVADLERALAFYRDGLGFSVAREYVRRGDEDNVYLDDGTGRELQLKHAPGRAVTAGREGFDHLAVEVEDVDATVGRLGDLGGTLQRGPNEATADGFRYAFVADPDGHRVELVQYLE